MPIYMKYEGIAGSATGNRKDWIELQSAQLGSSTRGGFGGGEGTGKIHFSEISITKYQDSASSHLFRESLNGEGKKVTIEFVKTDGTVYMKIELEGTMIVSYSISGHGGDSKDKPMESLSLNFTKITFTVTAADSKSSKDKAVWDLATP